MFILTPDATSNEEENAENAINIPFSTIMGKCKMGNRKSQTDQSPSFHIIVSFLFPFGTIVLYFIIGDLSRLF